MNLFEIIKVIILGIIEGITEWLPISSTGHLILAQDLVKLEATPQFMEMFNVVIQLGAILAVVVLFWHKLNPLSLKKTKEERKATWILWSKVVIGCIPAAVLGKLLDDYMEMYFNNSFVVSLALIVYGIMFIVVEREHNAKYITTDSLENLSYKKAFGIGLFQCLALIPGTSRSGSTIIGGLLLGTERTVAAEFSFFMGIPIMFGASALKLRKFGFSFTTPEMVYLAVGVLVSFIVALLAIKFLMNYIKRHDFQLFGWYRIVLGIAILVAMVFGFGA